MALWSQIGHKSSSDTRLVTSRHFLAPAPKQPSRFNRDKRIKEGKTKTEAIRCLKRYIARELYAELPREALA